MPIDIEDFRARAKGLDPKMITLMAVVIGIGFLIYTGFYIVEPNERGVVQRFGKFVRLTQPGPHLLIPFGIETVRKVPTETILKEEFGFRTLQPGIRTQYSQRDYPQESLMLTGDLNIADVEWIVQYRITDPTKYLFHIRDPVDALRDLSEVVTRKVVGDWAVTGVLTLGRVVIASQVKEELQRVLETYETGISVVNVKLQDVNPPEAVRAAFNEVNEAKQERETLENQGKREYNTAIPKAIGEAERTIAEARGYGAERINRSQGDAKRFRAIWEEYRKAKDVTRRRLYIETLREVIPRVEEVYVVDQDQQSILPLLQLNQNQTNKGGER